MDLKDKVVVITGGTKGLGKAMALSFVKNYSKVVVCDINEEELKNLDEGILGIRADVTKELELQNVLEFIKEKFGRLDVWVNNAGVWVPHKPIEEVNWNEAHNLMEVNFFGTAYGSKIALEEMRKQKFGSIINIISVSALEGKINETAYCASKFAVKGFTESLKKEIKNDDIKIMSVYPSRIKTSLFGEEKQEDYEEYMEPSFVAEKIVDNLKKEIPEEELIIRR
jgi:NAD(P)-dependent dehydrogenase (short-subunit alcohol dehydrogenase family)